MPYDPKQQADVCPLCKSAANVGNVGFQWVVVDCSICGDFKLSSDAEDAVTLPIQEPKKLALVRHLLCKLQKQHKRPTLDASFFKALAEHRLPNAAEACDNGITWFAQKSDYRPGPITKCVWDDDRLWAALGLVNADELQWVLTSLQDRKLLQGHAYHRGGVFQGSLTAEGWERFEELQRAHVSSDYAFFARKFENDALDDVVEKCLRPAVEQTGFKLQTATQKAGPIDAIIEDEIRRCKFLLADLSDDNAGAYWEAGFAEGLGKPVIYTCCEKDGIKKKTHFDTEHRHTIWWNLESLDSTSKQLKAVIRNTLLGDAKQDD